MIRVVLSPLFAGQRQQVTSPIGRPEIWERAQFQLDKKHFGQTPSPTPGEHELRLALKGLEPLPDTIDRFLDTKPLSVGEIRIRACSALIKPENEEILAAIREHRQLRGYLEAGAPAGYLLIKAQSDPYNFIQRCEQLGFTVKSL